jgi:hypothetical protein
MMEGQGMVRIANLTTSTDTQPPPLAMFGSRLSTNDITIANVDF